MTKCVFGGTGGITIVFFSKSTVYCVASRLVSVEGVLYTENSEPSKDTLVISLVVG